MPEPIYATYEAVVAASGAAMVDGAAARRIAAFIPISTAIARAVTPRTRVDLDQQPAQPDRRRLHRRGDSPAIAEICRKHDLWLLSDEVYEDLAFTRPHVSPWSVPGMAERTVVVSSLSKSHAMPGFRLGWIIGPPALSRHLFNAAAVV